MQSSVLAETYPATALKQGENDLSQMARGHLAKHPHFRGRVDDVAIDHDGRTLFVTGKLPTFYLKQLVQESLRQVPGVCRIDNRIDVASPVGISSTRD
ncbi:MAG: BON domain-containing protein [Pirellulales bacterium]|nr:BON domain-containing protein [Pirellulales bacterium]